MERSTRQLLSQCHRSHHQRCHREPQYHQLQLYRHCQLQKSFLTLRLPLPPTIGWTPTHQIHHRKNMLFTPEIKGGFDVLVPCQLSDTEKSWKCFSHLTNWKSNSKFCSGRLELFWWPFNTFFVEKAIIAIVHSYSLVAMHFALAPFQFALTMNILGSVGGNLWSKPWKFMKSGWNIAPLMSHEHPTLRRQGHFHRE